jgi:rubrerythrin
MTGPVLEALGESRRRERAQTRFYRVLSARAEEAGREGEAERLAALHADEQHHLARLTARILELGGAVEGSEGPLRETLPEEVDLDDWEGRAREREGEEVAWYRELLDGRLDASTRALVQEILESEERHARELAGKWMSA